MGALVDTWTGRWIEPKQEPVTEEPEFSLAQMFGGAPMPEQAPVEERLHPTQLLRRAFETHGQVEHATLRMTARGLYQTWIDGRPVTEAVLLPGFTSYHKDLRYQEFDVTALLTEPGGHVWAAELADGWWAGRVAVQGQSAQWGDRLQLLGELVVQYADGTREVVGTDGSFVAAPGSRVYADIQIGEKRDLRLEQESWQLPEFDDAGWIPVMVTDELPGTGEPALLPQEAPLARVQAALSPVSWWREDNAIVVDFGQVIAGRVALECLLGDCQELVLRHAEALDASGRFFENIVGRNKDQRDVFVGRGQCERLEPAFTFHGFRFVRIEGWDEALQGPFDPTCIEAHAIWAGMRYTGRMITSDTRLNRLLENVLWSARGNLINVPTDCPQRERIGWVGDALIFAPTASFLYDVNALMRQWLASVRADQLADGQILDYSPAPRAIMGSAEFLGALSSAGWGDAIVLVPWTLWQRYGDLDVLRDNYEAMCAWHDFSVASAAGEMPAIPGGEAPGVKEGDDRYIWDTKFHYGDWMFPSYMMGPDAPGPVATAKATADLCATAYLAHTSDVLAQVAELLGDEDRTRECRTYAANVRRAFVSRFVRGDGLLDREFQGCYVLALAFDLLPEEQRQAAADHLAQMVVSNGNRLDVGFLGMPHLMDVLCRWGHANVAEALLYQDVCPSWLYEVDRGATTIWESWANVAPDGTVGTYSFNHYSFGCVEDWMARYVGGLAPAAPGYEMILVAPHPVGDLRFCHTSFESVRGPIRVDWERVESDRLRVEVELPAGVRARMQLPSWSEPRTAGVGSHVFFG